MSDARPFHPGVNVHVYPSPVQFQSRVLKITRALVTHGVVERVLVVATGRDDLPDREPIDDRREVLRVSTWLRGAGLVVKSMTFVEWTFRILARLRRESVTMVNCHSLSALPVCVILAKQHRAVLVYEPHELETETATSKGIRRRVAKWLEASLIGYARRVLVVSDSIAAHYRRDYGLTDVAVVMNTPEPALGGEDGPNRLLRDRFRIPDGHLVFMYQGMLASARGASLLLDAFRRVPPNRHLVLMGFGPLEADVRAVAAVTPNIHFHPAVPPGEVMKYTLGADVGITLLTGDCINHQCALPNKFFHYLQAGLPIIVNDLEEMGALVDQYQCGWKVAYASDSIARVVTEISEADLAARRPGARRAGATLNWDREEAKLLAVYEGLSPAPGYRRSHAQSATTGEIGDAARAYQICTRCVMDTTASDIEFDSEGVCSYCRAATERLAREYFVGEAHRAKREELIATIKREGAGKRYDCIIGVSGGADSTYVAYVVKRVFGLRPLAVHFDNGWNSRLAVENIEKLLAALEIDLYTHVVDWDEFRDLQRAFLRSSVSNCEIPTDHAIGALLYRIAAKHRVRFILHGGNLASESIMPAVWMQGALDLRFLRAIQRRFGTMRLKSLPTLSLARRVYFTFVRRFRFIGVLNYVEYRREEAMQFLTSEFQWRSYEGKHFESMFTRWFQGYLLPQKFGMDKRRPHFSSLIVSGQLTRAEALRTLEEPVYDAETAKDDVRYVCRKLSFSESDFQSIMDAPPKSIKDFPNSERALRWFSPLVSFAKALSTGRL